MTDKNNLPDQDGQKNSKGLALRGIKFLASTKLAMALLVAILVSCLVSVTVLTEEQASQMVFSTLWFNGMLVMLVLNVAFCFFSSIRKRRWTLTVIGMAVFHLSFVAIALGIAYNSLYYFNANIRLAEGETLVNADPLSYDTMRHGKYFDFSKLKGTTTLVRMHKGYVVEDQDKVVAYEIRVGEEGSEKWGVLYITKAIDYNGFQYLRDKEGYSILIVLHDEELGKELYGAYVPMQSLMQPDGSHIYAAGSKSGPTPFPFPYQKEGSLFHIQASYTPTPFEERGGDVEFSVWPFRKDLKANEKPLAHDKLSVGSGKKLPLGRYALSADEVLYWVGMDVRYDPGKPIVLASLWAGLAGMVMTFVGRLRDRKSKQ